MDKALEIAKNMNTILNYQSLLIPILDGFTVIEKNLTDPNHKIIFVAVKNNTLEQFIGDGILGEQESVDDRIEKVVKDIKKEVGTNKLYDGNNEYLCYYKNYDNANFDYKIYVQDILSGSEDDLRFARQLSAFFVEPIGNEFYQISVAAGSYAVNKGYKLLKDLKNYEEDEIIKGLEANLKIIMDNIVYK